MIPAEHRALAGRIVWCMMQPSLSSLAWSRFDLIVTRARQGFANASLLRRAIANIARRLGA